MSIINAQIHANLSAILSMLLELNDSQFNGDKFNQYDASRIGCAIHWAFHKKSLVHEIYDYIIAKHVGGRSFKEPDFLRLLDVHYGEGANYLFYDQASYNQYNKG